MLAFAAKRSTTATTHLEDPPSRTEVPMRVASIAASLFVGSTLANVIQAPIPTHAASASPFVGTWRLVSITGTDREGAHPKGLIYYDNTGHMAAQIAPDRVRPSWPPNAQPS